MKHIRKYASLLLVLALALSLCACGSKSAPAADETPAKLESTLPGTAKNDPDAAKDADPLAETKAKILALKDHPVSELYALIGQPKSSDYAPSCMGDGEDGCLYYDGFTVYTYREGESEVVYDVE